MTRVPMTQAVAADYADAMLVARRAKNVLFLFLALVLLLQLGIFFVAKYVPSVKMRIDITTTTTSTETGTTSTSTDVHAIERKPGEGSGRQLWSPILEYVIPAMDFLGIVFAVALPVILLLVIAIMLVGRLVGVSHVTSAFCWSIVFLVLLFPWQSLLNSGSGYGSGQTATTTAVTPAADVPDIRIPGVLYTYPELRRDYDFPNAPAKVAVLKWSRFVVFPIVELILLLIVQGRSSRGLRFALGEAELPTTEYTTTTTTQSL